MTYFASKGGHEKGQRLQWYRRCVFCFLLFFVSLSYGAWPTYHGDPSLKGVSEVSLEGTPKRVWSFNSNGRIDTPPVSDGERIFISMGKGRVAALDLSGEKLWERTFTRTTDAGEEVALRFEAPLVCAQGLVFAGSTRGTLFALDAKSGDDRWQYDTEGIIAGSPNFIVGSTLVSSSSQPTEAGVLASIVVLDQLEGALHRVDIASGKRLWKTEGVERCDGAPGVGTDYIAFGSCLAKLHVYAHDGKHLKDIDVGGDGQIAGGVAIDGKRAYAGLRDGGLLCFDLENGETVWSSDESEDQTFSTPAVTDDFVIYASDNGFVYAVKKSEGTTVWTFDTGGLPYSPVAAKDRVLVVADGVLYLLDPADGHLLWSKEISDEITSPALVGNLIVVGADDGSVSARVSVP